MFCPNCGHKVDPDQKFCDNCGYALKKKKTETTNQVKDDDTIRSLSDIENELNQEDKSEKNLKLHYNKLLLNKENMVLLTILRSNVQILNLR